LYLILNPSLRSYKIGIANPAKIKKSDRLHRYQYHGWVVLKVWDFPTGKEAEEVENRILRTLRIEKKIPPYLTISDMGGQGGHTETLAEDAISELKLIKLINRCVKS
jgi:hypothetical protein